MGLSIAQWFTERVGRTWTVVLALLLGSCVTSGKSLHLSEPQFSHL